MTLLQGYLLISSIIAVVYAIYYSINNRNKINELKATRSQRLKIYIISLVITFILWPIATIYETVKLVKRLFKKEEAL